MRIEKFQTLLGTAGMLQLAVIGLFFTAGCTPEDPPMPPGIYVPKKIAGEETKPAAASVVDGKLPGTAEFDTKPMPVIEPLTPAPVAVSQKTTYTVVKGDSLWSVAHKHNLTVSELASANNLPANATLRIGQKLTIPAVGQKNATKSYKTSSKKSGTKRTSKGTVKTAVSGKKTTAASASAATGSIYIVKPGDNFSKIAKRNGMKVSELIAANPGVDSSHLKVGQKLNLKNGAGAETAASAKTSAKTSKKADKNTAAKTGTASSAPAPANAAASDKAENLDDMLKDIKDPDQAEKPAETAAAPAASTDAKAAPAAEPAAEKDKLEDLPDGTVALTLSSDTELSKFCLQYKVKEGDLKMLNPSLPADGKLKKGTIIKLP